MLRILLVFLVLIGAVIVFFFGVRPNLFEPSAVTTPTPSIGPTISSALEPTARPVSKLILHDVPFVSQAPNGRWDDPRQQDGCEEAASYMAVLWARDELPPGTPAGIEQKLLEISDWEKRTYGSYRDTSSYDTGERIFKGYFGYHNFEVKYDITARDIKNELRSGNIIIVPADGRALGNPYYTAPGPERHNLVIRGYDPKKDQFITNDNGTKRGEGYRYKTSVLMNAIRDYPTGEYVPISGVKRTMIVVRR